MRKKRGWRHPALHCSPGTGKTGGSFRGGRIWNRIRSGFQEIMLQQTRVEAVKPYFARFMEALPDITSLAQVDEERLLKLWEGLGYYSRARNLKKAAVCLVEDYGGSDAGVAG